MRIMTLNRNLRAQACVRPKCRLKKAQKSREKKININKNKKKRCACLSMLGHAGMLMCRCEIPKILLLLIIIDIIIINNIIEDCFDDDT